MPREVNKAYVKDCLEDTNKDKNGVIVSTQNLAEFMPYSFIKLFQRTQTALICFIRTFSLVDGSCRFPWYCYGLLILDFPPILQWHDLHAVKAKRKRNGQARSNENVTLKLNLVLGTFTLLPRFFFTIIIIKMHLILVSPENDLDSWPQFFESWIAVSTYRYPVKKC